MIDLQPLRAPTSGAAPSIAVQRPAAGPARVAPDTYIDPMRSTSDFPEAVTQDQRLSDFLADDQGPWTTVYQSLWPDEDFGIFSVFASRSRQAEMLRRPEWEMHPYDGRPGFVSDERGASRYGRYGRTDKTRPVVVLLSHGGVLPQMLPQVLEEFRHFHNLWEDPVGGVLKKLLADGSEEVVCKVTQRRVQIRSSYLRRFQAATQLCLVRFVDSIVNTPNDQQWTAADLAALDQIVRTDSHLWSRDVRLDIQWRGEVSSRIRAKAAVAAPPRDQCGAWPWDDGSRDAAASYRIFIVAETPTGDPIEHTCDPESMASNFGVSDDLLLGRLTPVFFDRLVLHRYYANPQKYRVEDNSVACGALWSLRIDNNHREYVVVFLRELGMGLPQREQDHWRLHNIAPPGSGLSTAAYGRWIQGEWTDPDSPEWQFKHSYDEFRKQCLQELGWDLWRDTHDRDGSPLLLRVRMPLTDTVEELNELARLLDLVLVEALNTTELKQQLGATDRRGSIKLLGAWLAKIGYTHTEREIQLLRRIHDLRNAASHRDDANSAAQRPGVSFDPQQAAAEILAGATEMMRSLRDAI